MDFNVHFRFNKTTGEVEAFEIEDLGSGLPIEEHNRQHDRAAAEIGGVIERNPHVVEVFPGQAMNEHPTRDERPQEIQDFGDNRRQESE